MDEVMDMNSMHMEITQFRGSKETEQRLVKS